MTPRGIEILVKKASVDGAFRGQLLEERSGAAERIGLTLDAAEAAMLDAIPEAQLITIIEKTKVAPLLRPVFIGYAAAAMLAAVGGVAAGNVEMFDQRCLGNTEHLYRLSIYWQHEDGTYSTYFSPDAGITYVDSAAGVRPDIPEKPVRLSDDTRRAIRKEIRKYEEHVTSIYDNVLKTEPDLETGVVKITFVINRDGSKSDIELLSNSTGSSLLASYLMNMAESIIFEPIIEDKVRVIYPLSFLNPLAPGDSNPRRSGTNPAITMGYISGLVCDENGEALEGVYINVIETDLGMMTNADGYYCINGVPPGLYEVTASLDGYPEMTIADVEVVPDLRSHAHFTLEGSE